MAITIFYRNLITKKIREDTENGQTKLETLSFLTPWSPLGNLLQGMAMPEMLPQYSVYWCPQHLCPHPPLAYSFYSLFFFHTKKRPFLQLLPHISLLKICLWSLELIYFYNFQIVVVYFLGYCRANNLSANYLYFF